MAKLKFDRSISLIIKANETVTVPADEVWRAAAYPADAILINGIPVSRVSSGVSPFVHILGGGTIISPTIAPTVALTGVAFKVIKEE